MVFALACIVPAWGDVVETSDGSKLVGKVLGVHKGKMTLETAFAGELVLDMENVTHVTTDEPRTVKFQAGEAVTGKLLVKEGKGQLIEPAKALPQACTLGWIDALWDVGGNHPDEVARQAKWLDEQAAKEFKWSIHLEGGVLGTSGNTDRIAANGAMRTELKNDEYLFGAYLRGRYSRQEGVDIEQEIIGGLDARWEFSDRWFTFAMLEFENDPFDELRLRTTGTAGMGFYALKEEDYQLQFTGGLGYECKEFEDGEKLSRMIGDVGMLAKVAITPWLEYRFELMWFPSLEDLGDYRIEVGNYGVIPLTDDKSWKIKAGVHNKYVSRPSRGAERLDTRYFINLVWDWE